MRIVMMVDAVYEDAVGGSRVVVRELAHRLCAQGNTVTIVAPAAQLPAPGSRLPAVRAGSREPGARSCEPSEPGATPYRIRRFPHRGPASLIREAAGAVREVAAEGGVDVVHVHFSYPAVGIHLRPLAGVPIVRSYYGSWAAEAQVETGVRGAGYRARWAAEALSLRRCDRVIVLSEYSRGEVTKEFRVPPERVDLVPGGVDTERFRPGDRAHARVRLGLPGERRILLTVRRLVPRMGLDALVEAWALVVNTGAPGPLLLIGGRGPEEGALRSRAAALALEEHVRFLGFVPDDELPLYYQAADAYVLPTRALEGFGLTTLEAFASGLPVLGTPVAATPELLRPVDPCLVLPGVSAEEMAAGVHAFLEGPLPATCRPDRLRSFAGRYSWDRIAAETLAVYETAVQGALPRGARRGRR